tara:strand:- start:239 stop:1240 length:1002 start_codon:yes stop_codon:yes gene_type:complete
VIKIFEMKKILVTSYSFKLNPGGASKRNFYISKYLSKYYDVYLVDWNNISLFKNLKKVSNSKFSWTKFFKIILFEKIHVTFSDTIKFALLPLPNLYYTIHDMREWSKFARENFLKKFLLKYIVSKCNKLITVSFFQKKKIKKIFKKSPYVIENGLSEDWSIKRIKNKKKIIKNKYIIYVSNFSKNKNHLSLEKQSEIFKGYKIVLVGRALNKNGEKIINNLKKNNYIFMNNIKESKLVNLIYYSEFVIFPSSYEGFGIPVLEAIKLKKKVLVNNVPSLSHFKKFEVVKYVNFNSQLKKSNISWAINKNIKKIPLKSVDSWRQISEQIKKLIHV